MFSLMDSILNLPMQIILDDFSYINNYVEVNKFYIESIEFADSIYRT